MDESKKKLAPIMGLILVLALGSLVFAQGKFSGYMFGDYYYNVSNSNSALKNQNGFWLRRIYFTYDFKISENWSTRFRLELNSPGDFKTSDTLKSYIKDGYLSYKKNAHSLILGLSPTPTWEFLEKFWGYRSVEKTPLDLYKMGDSRDLGIAAQGSFGKEGFFGYHIQIGNGEGTKSEVNKEKKYMGAFLLKLTKNISFEFYTDYAQGANQKNYYTYQGFLGLKMKKANIGVQYAHQTREQGVGKSDLKLDVYSIFGVLNLSEKVSFLARYDRMDNPLPWGSTVSYVPFNNNAPFNFILVGLDLRPIKNVSFIPNLMYVSYDSVNSKSYDNDIQFKLTFFYSF